MARWTHSNTCVFNINYHLIWCTKYRRKVLNDDVQKRFKELIYNKADEMGIEIKAMETMEDHVHIFVSSTPEYAPHEIVQAFKGMTSRILRKEFLHLRTRLPTLWTRSYYCESVGHLSESTIKKYVEDQKKIDDANIYRKKRKERESENL